MRASLRAAALVAGICTLLLGLLAGGPTAASADEVSSRRGTVTASAPFLMPMEPYAGYQPQTPAGAPRSRACDAGRLARRTRRRLRPDQPDVRRLEPQRAQGVPGLRLVLDATERADAALAAALLDEVLAPDDTGEPDELARRMGVMYMIWNDTIYASYDRFVRATAAPAAARAALLPDAAPPRPPARLADPAGAGERAGTSGGCPPLRSLGDRLLGRRRCRPSASFQPSMSLGRARRRAGVDRRRADQPAGASSARGCAPTSRRCGRR